MGKIQSKKKRRARKKKMKARKMETKRKSEEQKEHFRKHATNMFVQEFTNKK